MAEPKIIRSPDTERPNRVPPGQRLVEDMPVLHEGRAPEVDLAKWTIRLFGEVEAEKTLTYPQFLALPRVRVLSDIHCVTGWSMLDNLWDGVAASEMIKQVKLRPEARFVMVHGYKDYSANLSLEDFLGLDVLFTARLNDKPLPAEHGYPIRLLVPRLYLWKSAKWVTAVEFMRTERLGFWESRGYHRHGDPWREERYSSR